MTVTIAVAPMDSMLSSADDKIENSQQYERNLKEDDATIYNRLHKIALHKMKPFLVCFFGKTIVRSVPNKVTFSDIEQLGIIHYIPGFNIIYDSKSSSMHSLLYNILLPPSFSLCVLCFLSVLFETAPLPEEVISM